jgi:tetratricopeptide (TPR) repeat protein
MLALLPVLGRSLHDTGEWEEAERVFTRAVELARDVGDRRVLAEATLGLISQRLYTDAMTTHDQVRDELAEPVRIFEELGDEAGLARAVGLCGQLRFWRGDAAGAIADLERSAQHARQAGDRNQEVQSLHYVLIASLHGPVPVEEALALCAGMRGQAGGDVRLEVTILRCQGRLEALRGDFNAARTLLGEALTLSQSLGLRVAEAGVRLELADVELLAGDPVAAEKAGRPGADALREMGNNGHFVTVAPILADALVDQGRRTEAAELVDLVRELAMEDDLDPQIGWRRVRGKLLALEGELEEAERLGRESTRLADSTDFLLAHVCAHEDLAETLRLAGRSDEAAAELERALELHERKGNLVAAARIRAKLDTLSRTIPAA